MPEPTTVRLTGEAERLVQEALRLGHYQSIDSFLRDAAREWLLNRDLGRLRDEGMASGLADPAETMTDIKRAGRTAAEQDS